MNAPASMLRTRKRRPPGNRPSTFIPYGAAKLLIESQAPEVAICGPVGTGKSVPCLVKLLIIADRIPGVRLLVVRKTRASLTESALASFETHVLPESSPVLAGPKRFNRHTYTFPNGSEIIVGGMDNATRIMSTEFDMVYVQEATELTEDDWEKLASRLRNYKMAFQQIIGDCNPSAPTHWLKQRCDRGACLMLNSQHVDNPLLWNRKAQQWTNEGREYMDRLDRLTGVRRERLLHGRWASAEGSVYEWNQAIHMVDRFPIPALWKRIRAIDFGYTNPFCCLWIAVDADNQAYVYRQLYMTKRLVEDHAKQIVAMSEAEKIVATVADHDAEDNATLTRHGIHTTLANKSIRTGIDIVSGALRVQKNGKPQLHVMRDSLVEVDRDLQESKRPWCLEQEFDSYRWPNKKPNANSKEVPVDEDNHALDALRYGMMYVNQKLLSGQIWAWCPSMDEHHSKSWGLREY